MTPAHRPVDKPRPIYLDLFAIRQPLPAIVSILHRISGALLFLVGLPLVLWGLQTSLSTPEGFDRLAAWLAAPAVRLLLVVLTWAWLHHLIAGIRHLLADVHIGLDLGPARQSAALTLVLAVLLTLALAVRLW
jgi:succinate dehydrogenase / fumarate reductase cytochrome b subunit